MQIQLTCLGRFLLLTAVLLLCFGLPHKALSEEHDGSHGKSIALSESAERAIGLETAILRLQPISIGISTVGKVEAIPTREFVQHAPLSGRVTQVLVKPGDKVNAGQTLAMLNSPEINILAAETLQTKSQIEAEIKRSQAELDAEINQATARVDLTQANYNRDKQLYEEQIASQKAMQTSLAELKVAQSQLQMAKARKEAVLGGLTAKLKVSSDSLARRLQQLGATQAHIQKMLKEQRALANVPLVSARDGIISRIDASPGQNIEPTVPLFVVSDLRRVWATANVYESDMSAVRIGQDVELTVAAYPEKHFKGVVTFVSPTVDAQTRTLPVRIEIDNPDLSLKPGMFARLSISTAASRQAILIPRNALVQDADKYVAFISDREGYRPAVVQLGKTFGQKVEIVSGLTPGDKVVVKGAFQLDAERLKLQGQTDLFTHPSEEAEEEHEVEQSSTGSTTQSQTLTLVAIAFLLGIALTILSILALRARKPVSKEDSRKLAAEQDQISTHAE
jgi:cobalt-zinc-cadmium efflux system membrane fusion protein